MDTYGVEDGDGDRDGRLDVVKAIPNVNVMCPRDKVAQKYSNALLLIHVGDSIRIVALSKSRRTWRWW